MKYQKEILIHCPMETVHEKFIDLEKRPLWQKGLISTTLIKGQGLEEGTRNSLVFDTGKTQMTMVETILENDLPRRIRASYETRGVLNISDDRFEAVDERTTRYLSIQEFQMNAFMMKLMGFFMSGMFRKQTYETMEDFKSFCEEKTM